jgi:chromosome segregation ATPase
MAASFPNSDFQAHGFQYESLEENRAVNYAVDYWHARFDLDKKSASVKGLHEQLRQVKYSFKRVTETNIDMRKAIKVKDTELEGLHKEILELRENTRREKQNSLVQAKTLSKNRTHMDSLETELRNKLADIKDLELQLTQLRQSSKEDFEKATQKIHMLSERNANLSTTLNELRQVEGKTARQLEDMKVERDHLERKVGTQQNMLDFKENSHFSTREQERPTEDFVALEDAYEELHGKLEVMWAERDEALGKVQSLSRERDAMVSKIMARGLQHTLL